MDPDGPQGSLADGTGTAAVRELRDVLADRWTDLDTDDNVVTINYGDEDVASYEVAPVFPRNGGGYSMPNGAGWMDTDPQEQAELVTAKNKACDAKFVPFVKMVKGINREAGDPIDPSFLLEVMGLELVIEPFGRYRDEIRFFLASVADRIVDDWPDPVGLGPDINTGVGVARRTRTVVRGARMAGCGRGSVAAGVRGQRAGSGRNLARVVRMADATAVRCDRVWLLSRRGLGRAAAERT